MSKIVSFNVESESQLRDHARRQRVKKQEAYKVTISFKYGTVCFGTRYVEDNQLDGKYVKFYVDASRTKVLWSKFDDTAGYSNLEVLKEYRQVKPTMLKNSPRYSFNLKRFLTQAFPLEAEQGKTVRQAQVQSCIISHMNSKKLDYVEIR